MTVALLPTALRPPPDYPTTTSTFSPDPPPDDTQESIFSSFVSLRANGAFHTLGRYLFVHHFGRAGCHRASAERDAADAHTAYRFAHGGQHYRGGQSTPDVSQPFRDGTSPDR